MAADGTRDPTLPTVDGTRDPPLPTVSTCDPPLPTVSTWETYCAEVLPTCHDLDPILDLHIISPEPQQPDVSFPALSSPEYDILMESLSPEGTEGDSFVLRCHPVFPHTPLFDHTPLHVFKK